MLIRRKLFAYTVMFAAGIAAGFFIFERTRVIGGIVVMTAAGAIAAVFSCRIKLGPKTGPERHRILNNNNWVIFRDTAQRQLCVMLIALAAGYLLFTARYITYGTSLHFSSGGNSYEESWNLRTVNADDDRTDYPNVIEGFAREVTVKDSRMRIVLDDCSGVRHGVKILVTVKGYKKTDYGESKESQVERTEETDEGGQELVEIIGSRIRIYGELREPDGADNPGCFDYRVYLRSRGIGYTISANSFELDQDGVFMITGRYLKAMMRARESFLDLFSDEDIRAIIKGAVFGDRSDIPEEVSDEFNENGTGHILAVSGLHTGFLYSLLRLITGKKRNSLSTVLVLAALVMYGDMTMWSPSAERAVIVLSMSLLSMYVRRPFDLLTSVSAAALFILIREPYQLFNTGFQMSFMALIGIAFLADPLSHFTGDPMAAALAVQAGILPLTAYTFHRMNLLSIFINIPIIFIASVLVPLCMGSLMLMTLAGTLSVSVSSPGWMTYIMKLPTILIEGLTEILLRLNSMMAGDGKWSVLVAHAGSFALFLFYFTILIVSSEWFRVRLLRREYLGAGLAAVMGAVMAAAISIAAYNPFINDEIVFVSVGQGDCTHIRGGSTNVLIDGGGTEKRNIGKDVLMPYLLSNGAERAEICLVTHLHTDHYKGIYELSEVFPVGRVGIPEDYRRSIETEAQLSALTNTNDNKDDADDSDDKSILQVPENIMYISEGSRIRVSDEVYIDPIWPLRGAKGEISIDDANENNMVYIVNCKGIKIMVTGDLLEEDELEMVRYYSGTDVLDCDILKVGHHGSKTSSSEDFLDAVSPAVAVIEVGAGNMYGHPHQQTLDRLADRGIEVYRTDLNGAVGIDVDMRGANRGFEVDTMR